MINESWNIIFERIGYTAERISKYTGHTIKSSLATYLDITQKDMLKLVHHIFNKPLVLWCFHGLWFLL